MRVFDDNEWNSSTAPVAWEVPPSGQSEIIVSCTAPVELRGVRDDGSSVLLHAGREYRVTAFFRGYRELLLRGTGKEEFGYRVRAIERQDGEPLNSDNPPAPPLPGNDNLLLQVKRMMRAEFDRNRAPFLEPEELFSANRYAIEDDDDRFEEELHAEHLASQQKPSPAATEAGPEPKPAPAVPEAPASKEAAPAASLAAE